MTGEADYRRQHDSCPRCGHADIERTCMGFIVSDWLTHVDSNTATCAVHGCGWVGIVHDLAPERSIPRRFIAIDPDNGSPPFFVAASRLP